ncbi:hypothetical protein [Serratia marcescens]|uniref:hypothetical protein n=1 Tax=Serratia marcescens TaxID=615 RepID=UPI003D026FDB
MITLADMQRALDVAREKKNELQIKLRKAASELVSTYQDSLQAEGKQLVETGEWVDGGYCRMPVTAIELGQEGALNFVLSTTLENHVVSKFKVSVSIEMRERDQNLAVRIEGEALPVLVVGDAVEGRFYETAERIKAAVLAKIDRLV